MSDGDAKPKTGSTANPQERFTVALPDHTIGLPRGSRAVGLAAGIFLALMVVAWSPWGSPSATLRAGVLAGGAGVFLPIAIVRWRRLFVHGGVGRWRLTGALVAIALAGWSLLDAILQGLLGSAPLLGSVYGWFGRGLGAVSLLSAAVVLVTFAVLTSAETRTAYACFAIAAGVSALVTCLQVAGVDVVGTVVDGQAQGLLGNADFASAVYGIAVVPSVVAAVEWVGSRRWVAAALTVVLVAGLALSGPFQGPLAAVFGLMVAVGILITLPGTPRRLTSLRVFLAALIVLAGIGAAAVILMWSQRADALESRVLLWRTALSAVGQFPVLGSGPDGFARVFGQARPEAFLDIRPPEYHASAAHDVPLQIGATLGLPGLLLWFALIAVVVVVVVRWLRQRTQVDALGAALVGAATAYLAQSLVSIDMLALVAVGWALLGSCLGRGQGEVPKTRIPALAWLCSLVLGILGAGVILPSAWASVRAMDARTSDEIVTSLASPWTPCDRLDVLAQRLLRSEEPAQAIPALREAAARDPRCIGIQQVLAQAALDAGNMPLAQDTAQGIVSVDPLNTPAWLALAVAQASQGDLAAAQESLDNAERLAAHDPKRYADSIASVKDLIAAGGTPTTSLG